MVVAIATVAGTTDLEFDPADGQRGECDTHLEPLLRHLMKVEIDVAQPPPHPHSRPHGLRVQKWLHLRPSQRLRQR
ncbi:MAG: hypothetical protein IRY87_01715 [Acetobacteraceae bacterium]|nr:hypothetical protein [Acetobacteraceae bacterium]